MLRVAASCAGALVVCYVVYRRNQRVRSLSAPTTSAASSKASDKASSDGKQCVTLVAPILSTTYTLEYSVHRCSRLLRTDVELVFRPDLDAEYRSDPRGAAAGVSKDDYLRDCLLAVPTWQPSKNDLSEISYPVNQERKTLLNNFDAWAQAVRPRLGCWSDCSCPMEGNARYGKATSTIYNELEGLTQLLRYDAIPIGCCGIVLHPQWQRRAYPVTFFTTAPLEKLQAVLAEIERQ